MTIEESHRKAHAMGRETTSVALVPRISIQAFCEHPQTAEVLRSAFADRRMARAHGAVVTGGIPAAVRLYQTQSTPNLLIVETDASRDLLMDRLVSLAEVCQPDTKVVVLGHVNDVVLYRELIKQGVSEYVVAPFAPLQMVDAIVSLYRTEAASAFGRVIAFVGAKGGVGSSTISHNCAWEYARTTGVETTIVDLDLAYGTAALNFNLDGSGGIIEALAQPERIDPLLLDRLLAKIGEKLSLLGGPGGVDKDVLIEAHAVESILFAMRASIPAIVVDLPNCWAPWVRFTLLHADAIVIVAEPELASLRNTRALFDMLVQARPNDTPPGVVLNQVGVSKRPEISPPDFQKAIGLDLAAIVPFDPQTFGSAMNNGRMVLDMAPRSKASESLRKLTGDILGKKGGKTSASANSSFLRKLLNLGNH